MSIQGRREAAFLWAIFALYIEFYVMVFSLHVSLFMGFVSLKFESNFDSYVVLFISLMYLSCNVVSHETDELWNMILHSDRDGMGVFVNPIIGF